MRKVIMILFIVLSTMLSSGGMAFSQETSAYATASISVNIILPLVAMESAQLSFGRFYPGSGGSIIISPNGNVIATSNVILDSSPKNPGSFVVSSDVAGTVQVSLPKEPVTITNEKSQTMVVDNWNSNQDKNIRLNDGSQTISIGATLNIGSIDKNSKGVYTGTYEITFTYN